MLDRADSFLDRVTFVTGPEKHCGKTSFMNRAAALARNSRTKGIALLSIGYDGEARDFLSGASKPAVPVYKSDIIVTTEVFARPCMPEILDVLPGSTALGRLCIARAGRFANIALLGPEGNKLVAWTLNRILEEKYASTIFVDGAINRITQASMLPGSGFVYVLRIDPGKLDKAIDRIQRLYTLSSLPGLEQAGDRQVLVSEDAISTESLAKIPANAKAIAVEDFTKIFLDSSELRIFLRDKKLYVKNKLYFMGFVIILRSLKKSDVLNRLKPELGAKVSFNPYEEEDIA